MLANSFIVSLSIKPKQLADAVIFSIVQSFSNRYRYLKISIENSFFVLNYDLGDGSVTAINKITVEKDKWYKVYVEQRRQYASISVNDKQAAKGVSNGREKSLKLDSNSIIHLGGSNKSQTNELGFYGCVKELLINQKNIDVSKDFVTSNKISSCFRDASPCLSNPCLNNGLCIQNNTDKFICNCTKDYEGKFCEVKLQRCGNYEQCHNGGECINRNEEDDVTEKFICLCPIGYGGNSCKEGIKLIAHCLLFIAVTVIGFEKWTAFTAITNTPLYTP